MGEVFTRMRCKSERRSCLSLAIVCSWGSTSRTIQVQPKMPRRRDDDIANPAAPSIAKARYLGCPLCESAEIPAILDADCSKHPIYQPALPPVMAWRECQSCGHVFTDGYFDAEAAAVLFAKTHANQTVGFDMERQRPVSARIIERVARHAPDGDWLDVGFGSGSLLFTAEEWGYAPVGLDLREENVQALRTLGYEAHRLTIEELGHVGRFNVVSMADALEHMPFPKAGSGGRSPSVARQGRSLSLHAEHGQHGLAPAPRQQRQSLLGRDRALPQFQPQAALRPVGGAWLHAC